jgi:hypothetical protein
MAKVMEAGMGYSRKQEKKQDEVIVVSAIIPTASRETVAHRC